MAELSADELDHFHAQGYVRVREVFPRAVADRIRDFVWSHMEAADGIHRDDPSTWDNRRRRTLGQTLGNGIYDGIRTDRMARVFDDILGGAAWQMPRGRGALLVNFPEGDRTAWDVTTEGWHWDGDPGLHLDGLRSVTVFVLLSGVRPRGGGTLVAAGSHRLIERFLRETGRVGPAAGDALARGEAAGGQAALPEFLRGYHPWFAAISGAVPSGEDRVRRFMETQTVVDGTALRVEELTGEAGDVVFCHPSILHARSDNRRDDPRFALVTGAGRIPPAGTAHAAP